MIGKIIETVWTCAGAITSVVTKLVSFGAAYLSEVACGNEKVANATRNVGDKIGDVIAETGYKAGELAGRAWDVTTDAVTGVAYAVSDGVHDILEDEEKSAKARKIGIAVGVTGLSLFAIGATMYCVTKKKHK